MPGKEIPHLEGVVARDARIHEAQKAHAKERLAGLFASQVASDENLVELTETFIFNPLAQRRNFEKLEHKIRKPEKEEKATKTEKLKEEGIETTELTQTAEEYATRNPELLARTLLLLHDDILPTDTQEEILQKLQRIYTDKALADEAVDFLIETAEVGSEMRRKLIEAKERFNADFGLEIRAGRNIGVQAREFSRLGLGSPTALRDLYRNIVGNPREPKQLFDELLEKFKYSHMKNIIDFILHALGTDLKAKGPSISKPELQRLFSEARTVQAILQLFRFFQARMGLIKGQFDRFDLALPMQISFELLARLLMKLLDERYPSPDKILKLAYLLGISEEVAAQIIIFSQYRDACRNISPKLFKSERHRQDLLVTLIETLSDLEDELEEEEEKEEKDDEES